MDLGNRPCHFQESRKLRQRFQHRVGQERTARRRLAYPRPPLPPGAWQDGQVSRQNASLRHFTGERLLFGLAFWLACVLRAVRWCAYVCVRVCAIFSVSTRGATIG
jgi:hypothetical protein